MSNQARSVRFDRDGVLDILHCLMRDALATLRHQPAMDFDPAEWPASMDLVGEGPMLDSLELMTLAGDVNRVFSLDETGLEDFLLRRRRLEDWVEIVMQAQPDTRGLRFMTSGSTGAPTEHEHAWEALTREVEHLAGRFSDRTRIIGFAPRHHIYGCLWGRLLPRALDVPVLVEGEAEAAVSGGLMPGDLIVGFPARWRYLASTLASFPDDVVGITSTGPCDATLIDSLIGKGLASMHEVYGSTETGGIAIRPSPRAPYKLFPWWQRDSESGTHLVRRSPGEAAAVEIPDRLEWEDEERFRPAGRRDGVVQVGGHNVSPDHVARRLTGHPDVLECRVRPAEGSRLKAFVVPAPGRASPELPDRLVQWARENLPVPERPVSVRVGDRLPETAMGKAADWD